MADRIFDPDDPNHAPSQQSFDGSWHTFGSLVELDEAGNLTGGSAWLPNPIPANLVWVVFRVSDESVVAQANLAALPGAVAGDWNNFTSADFVSPGSVALDAEQHVVAYATNGDFVFRDSGVTFPYGTGIVRATEARFFNGGAGAVFPDSATSGFLFPADMLVETDAGGSTHDGEGTATAVVSTTGVATVDRQAAGTASLASTASAAATVDREATATASLSLTVTGTATVIRAASGTATATLTATATATVTPGGDDQPQPTAVVVGPPHGRWYAGPPHGRWHAGPPRGA